MTKRVIEFAAAKKVAAWVIINPAGEVVAKVQAHFGSGGTVTVNVNDYTNTDYPGIQTGRATGGGYDKLVAALAGMEIDGQHLYDHSGRDEETEKILKDYQDGRISEKNAVLRAEKIGAALSNWNSEAGKYQSVHYWGGLRRLREMGYQVIQAI